MSFTLSLLGETPEEARLQARSFNLHGVGGMEGVGRGKGSMEDTGSEAMSEEGGLRRSVEEGTTEEISRPALGGKVIDEDGGKMANEEAAPAVEGEMNNNVMVKEDLPMEQSSDEDSDDLEVELMEEEQPFDEDPFGYAGRGVDAP